MKQQDLSDIYYCHGNVNNWSVLLLLMSEDVTLQDLGVCKISEVFEPNIHA